VWTIYGILLDDQKVYTPNAIGLIMGFYYFCLYAKYCPAKATHLPGTITQHVNATASILITITLIAFSLSKELALNLIGKVSVVFCTLLFASPLSAMKLVIETKSAKSIPLPFTLCCFLNCFLWSVVGLLGMNDFNIYFPNLMGLTCSVAQIALKMIYSGDTTDHTLPL